MAKLAINAVFDLVETEREFQDHKHGPIASNPHTVGEWILIMEAELQEAKVALIKGGKGRDSVLYEVLQVVAVGVACIEQHGMREIEKRSV